jgi:hypothetical protein
VGSSSLTPVFSSLYLQHGLPIRPTSALSIPVLSQGVAVMAGQTLTPAGTPTQKAWATTKGWEEVRETIKQLYLDQKKSLKEVMIIMERDHAFHATSVPQVFPSTEPGYALTYRSPKMYKSKIDQWGLNKKLRASDVDFVLRKKMQRQAVHKETSFTVLGRALDMQAVSKYEKRNHSLEKIEQEACTPATPDHISYQTPATSPCPQAQTIIPDAAIEKTDRRRDGMQKYAGTSKIINGRATVLDNRVYKKNWRTAPAVSELQGRYRWLRKPQLTRAVAPPDRMRISEEVLRLIPIYIMRALGNGIWALSTDRNLISTDKTYSGAAAQFMGHVIASFQALDQLLIKDGLQALGKAFALMPTMIRYDSPLSMQTYLAAVKHLINAGFPELADMIRRYMKEVAALTLLPQHPVSQIYALMSAVEMEELEHVLEIAWDCRNDSLTRVLSPFRFDINGSKIDCLNRMYWASPVATPVSSYTP